jgi:16S rRNA C967 or C1407 C5-methylase (RsmB/RsmF family)
MKLLVIPLPACFRIASNYAFADDLRKELLTYVGQEFTVNGATINAVEKISWVPNGSGYKLGTDRRSIRKLPELNPLHKWMVQHTENGNITRQEAVSMVPPIALDVQPHHKCLDMCASPGSKTSQLLEIIDLNAQKPSEEQGLVVANDADLDRSYMLVHQCRRINSPFLVATHHQGQGFPTIRENEQQFKSEFFDRVLCDVPCSGDGTLRKNPTIWGRWSIANGAVIHPLQLIIAKRGLQLLKTGGLMVYSTCSMSPYEDEAVVAELLRTHKGRLELVDARQFLPLFKSRPGLSDWLVLDDHYLLQKEIAEKKRAKKAKQDQQQQQRQQQEQQQQRAEGEDTDVMEVTEKAEEPQTEQTEPETKPEPADFSHIADPDLRHCLEMGMQWFPTFEQVPENLKWKYRASLFPPTEEERSWMHLERCLRCVPQDEDTGGFFVATLRKVAGPPKNAEEKAAEQQEDAPLALSAEDEAAALAAENDGEGGEEGKPHGGNGGKGKKGKQSQNNNNQNEPFVRYYPWDAESFQKAKEFYGFDEFIRGDCFYIREDLTLEPHRHSKKPQQQQQQQGEGEKEVAVAKNDKAPKTIYYIPKTVQSLLNGDITNQLRIVSAGIKVFEKKVTHNDHVEYRLLQDSMSYFSPHIHSQRKIFVNIQEFCNILGGGLVSYATLTQETLKSIIPLSNGVIICVYKFNPHDILTEKGGASADTNTDTVSSALNGNHSLEFSAVCWKGFSPCVNVMVSKIGKLSFLSYSFRSDSSR